MHLVQVDPVGLQPRERGLALADDRELRQAASFGRSPIVPYTFVASTTLSRLPSPFANHSPMIRSVVPTPRCRP